MKKFQRSHGFRDTVVAGVIAAVLGGLILAWLQKPPWPVLQSLITIISYPLSVPAGGAILAAFVLAYLGWHQFRATPAGRPSLQRSHGSLAGGPKYDPATAVSLANAFQSAAADATRALDKFFRWDSTSTMSGGWNHHLESMMGVRSIDSCFCMI